MRIIGGRFRGKQLEWKADETTRPTMDRVKENIFNILTSMGADFNNANVLVPFAGSGQMGIECFSRAREGSTCNIIFNDNCMKAVGMIQRNCISVGLKPRVVSLDYLECIDSLKGLKFNLVFLDPPFENIDASVKASKLLFKNEMLHDGAIIVVETECDTLEFSGFNVRKKNYGREVIYFLTKEI